MNMVAINPIELQTLEVQAQEWERAAQALAGRTLDTEAALTEAADMLRNVRTRYVEIEAQRTASTKPILAIKRQIDEGYDRPKKALSRLTMSLESMISAYHARIRQANDAAMFATQAALAVGRAPTEIIASAPKLEGVSVRTVWDFEITNPDLVPRELCEPSPKRIAARIPVLGTPPETPGVRWYQREDVTARKR